MASSIIPKALDGDISSLNDALANTERIAASLSGNASRTLTVLNDTVTTRLVAVGHTSSAALQGVYIIRNTKVYPIVDASGITVTVNGNDITIANATSNTCQYLVI